MKTTKKLSVVFSALLMAVVPFNTMTSSATCLRGDVNGDNDVDFSDMICIYQNFSTANFLSTIDNYDFDANGIASRMDAVKISYKDAGYSCSQLGIGTAGNYDITTVPANYTEYYAKYTASTGEYITQYSLTPPANLNNQQLTVDEDLTAFEEMNNLDSIAWDRTGVVKIIDSNGNYGTGFVVDSHTIATTTDVVGAYNSINPTGSINAISSIKLFNNQGVNTLSATPVEIHIPKDTQRKYALITVAQDVSSYNCFELGMALDCADELSIEVDVTSFPSAYNTVYDTMYTKAGNISSTNSTNMNLNISLGSGDYGSPVYATESFNGTVKYTVVGIGRDNSYNNVERVDPNMIRFYNENTNTYMSHTI